MQLFWDAALASPNTADGFIVSVIALLGAIIALFVLMRRKLRKK